MHRPRDDFEHELYGDQAVDTRRIAPARTLLGMAVAVYLLAAVTFFFRSDISTADPGTVVWFGGLLVVLGSGLLAGSALVVVWRLLERASRH